MNPSFYLVLSPLWTNKSLNAASEGRSPWIKTGLQPLTNTETVKICIYFHNLRLVCQSLHLNVAGWMLKLSMGKSEVLVRLWESLILCVGVTLCKVSASYLFVTLQQAELRAANMLTNRSEWRQVFEYFTNKLWIDAWNNCFALKMEEEIEMLCPKK